MSAQGKETAIDPDALPSVARLPAAAAPSARPRVSTAAAAATVLGLTAVGAFVVWAVRDGGYAPEEWLPGGLLLLAALAVAAISEEARARLRTAPLPLVLFGLYAVWSYASVAWAQVPGDALDGANRTLVYWLVFALFSTLPARRRAAATLVLAWSAAVAAAGLAALARAATAGAPAGHFVLGRLAAPISYPDADAALFLSACLPLLVLASRRQSAAAVRAGAGVAAVVLACLAVLCQSRGSLVALPLALLLWVCVARSRLRTLAHLAVAAAAVAPAVPALLDVYPAVVAGRGWTEATARAGWWIGLASALALAGFGGLALLDRRLRVPAGVCTRIGRTLGALAAAAAVTAAVAIALAHPVARAERAWSDLTTDREAAPTTLHFAAGLGTSRYDVWRIAVQQFLTHPLTGVGSDNYLVGYLRQRRTTEVSRYPESVELRALSETGVVGGVLFGGFLALASLRAIRAARRAAAPGVALACVAGCGYWLFHASVDWFWEYPALTGPALALLALAAVRDPARPAGPPPARAASLRGPVAAAATLAAAGALVLPWASVTLTDAAAARAGAGAYSWLGTAASLNPLSEQPALTAATLAADAGDLGRARRELLAALRRNPYDSYAYLMLGIVDGRAHRLALAGDELAEAHRLSPQDLVVVYAQRRLRVHEPLTVRQIERILLEVTSTLRGVRQR